MASKRVDEINARRKKWQEAHPGFLGWLSTPAAVANNLEFDGYLNTFGNTFGHLLGFGENGLWNDVFTANTDTLSRDELKALMEAEGLDTSWLDSVQDSELRALQQDYLVDDNVGNLYGWFGKDQKVDTEDLLRGLQLATSSEAAPEMPSIRDYFSDEYLNGLIGDRMSELEAMRSQYQTQYEDDLAGIDQDYGSMRQNLLATQTRQNAELMDTMRSEMSRSRRNALEAGASAGIRLADNINIMLSNQNKQAQTSLETSNQLAQMAINQRAARSQATGQYNQYMQQNFDSRNELRSQGLSEANSRYNADVSDWERRNTQWRDEHASHFNTVNAYQTAQKRRSGAYGGSN